MKKRRKPVTMWVDAKIAPPDWIELLKAEKFECLSFAYIGWGQTAIGDVEVGAYHLTQCINIPRKLPFWLMREQ